MTPTALALFLTFASISLLAIGGANVLVPELHRLLVDRHGWLDEATFAQLIALSQAAPGPNILAGSIMGFWLAGLPGLLAATLGLLGPAAILAWLVAGLTRRLAGARWLAPAQAGLVPVAVGLVLASGVLIAQGAAVGFALAPLVTLGATLFVWRSRFSPLWALAGGAAAGLLAAG